MADINPLPVFSQNGDKNTTGLNQTDGFPAALKPARQWFNYLFNAVTSKINELAVAVNTINNQPMIEHYGVDDIYMTLKNHGDAQAVHDYFNYGTWQRVAGGTYISAVGSNSLGYDFNGAGVSGENAHLITIDETPGHNHTNDPRFNKLLPKFGDVFDDTEYSAQTTEAFNRQGPENEVALGTNGTGQEIFMDYATIQDVGGGQPMPLKPRTTSFYFWQRIA